MALPPLGLAATGGVGGALESASGYPSHVGPNGAAYVTGELVPWVDGDCNTATSRSGVLFGCYHGESALALRLQGSYGAVGGAPTWAVTLGVEFRIPLLVGILFLSR